MSAAISESELQALRELSLRVVDMAKEAGASATEVLTRAGNELTAKIRLGEPELLQQAGSRALGLRIFVGDRKAVTHTSDLRLESLRDFVKSTVELARFAEPDDISGLPDAADMATSMPDLDLYDDRIPDLSAAWALEQCRIAERAAMGHDKRLHNSDGATWSSSIGATVFANSLGFVGGHRGTYGSLVVEPICDDDKDPTKKRNGHWWTAGRFLDQMEHPEAVGVEAAKRTLAQLGTRKIATQDCPIVFDPEVGRAIIGSVFSVTNGSAMWRKSTYLVGQEHKQIASPLLTIVDDPHVVRGPGSRPFDGDGLATRRNVIIDKGVLETVLCDVYSARKLGRKSTGSAGRGIGGNPGPTTSNLTMSPGEMTREALLKDTKRGLYITSLMGFGFNPTTGDFSRGAQGFWIENGEFVHPVSEVTVSANFAEILGRIDAVANDLVLRSSTNCPTFRVSSMTVAGSST